jgi:hypothetical protein
MDKTRHAVDAVLTGIGTIAIAVCLTLAIGHATGAVDWRNPNPDQPTIATHCTVDDQPGGN